MRCCRIERRIKSIDGDQVTEDWGVWQKSATASEISLDGQPRDSEIDYRYRVTAVNDQGDSTPSNSVMTVL